MRGVLILEDQTRFEGNLFGAPIDAAEILKKHDRGYGEAVFNTSMTGYQEILTDPSYLGQIICFTAAHIGNTGVNLGDPESHRVWCAGLIINELSQDLPHWQKSESLDAYLKRSGVPGLCGVDTRALTLHLRSKGVLRAVLLPLEEAAQAETLFQKMPAFEGRDVIQEASSGERYLWNDHPESLTRRSLSFPPPALPQMDRTDSALKIQDEIPREKSPAKKAQFKVICMDFGAKRNLLRSLEHLGCSVEVVPCKTSAKEILALRPDGVFLSNGPGDPTAAPYAAKTVSELLGKIPLFGVCMGHQILALAVGAKTFKMKFGHRGGNQPVQNLANGGVEISSHNHGYAVEEKSLPAGVRVSHRNLNDQTVEGIDIPKGTVLRLASGASVQMEHPAFSVQYHPESCPGPHDSTELFSQFVRSLKSAK